MDPISQAGLAASLSQSFADDSSSQKKSKQFSALIIGALAGLAPDLDVLIYSTEDPLLFLEYHRQFTHSLVFIPFGALICALLMYLVMQAKLPGSKRFKGSADSLSFAQVYLFSFLGYATHGLLDACTSYGTQLLWPFTDQRFSWNTVSIIDPLFTLPVVLLVLFAAYRKQARFAQIAFVYAVIFLSLGMIQKNRAENAVYELASQRGHQVERVQVKPGFATRHIWKLIYEYDGRYYVDAVKLLAGTEFITGTSIQKLDVKRDFPWLPAGSQQLKDIERFRWFSDDYLALSPKNPNLIMDVRYSYLPNRINSMWGVVVDKRLIDNGDFEKHVKYEIKSRPKKKTLKRYIEMMF